MSDIYKFKNLEWTELKVGTYLRHKADVGVFGRYEIISSGSFFKVGIGSFYENGLSNPRSLGAYYTLEAAKFAVFKDFKNLFNQYLERV